MSKYHSKPNFMRTDRMQWATCHNNALVLEEGQDCPENDNSNAACMNWMITAMVYGGNNT